jgi:prepilin-type N-terminal cleavage/methylation domain-containing protein
MSICREEEKSKAESVMRKIWAFTLVEILIVIALIALLAGVGGGIYIGTYDNMAVRKAARDFCLAAKYARILAIEHQRFCRIEIDAEENRYGIVIEEFDEKVDRTVQAVVQDAYFRPVQLDEDIEFEELQIMQEGIESEPSEEDEIIFRPDGTARAARVQIGDGENHYTVSISAATGKAVVYEGTSEKVEKDTIDLDREWFGD